MSPTDECSSPARAIFRERPECCRRTFSRCWAYHSAKTSTTAICQRRFFEAIEFLRLAGKLKQTQSLLSLVGSGIQMANAFLDVAANTKDPALRARCISKAEKSHQTLIKLVQMTAPERMDLIAALDELRWRYKWLRL